MQYPITDDRIDQVLELFSEDRTETEAGRLFLQDLQKILNTAYETGLNDRSRRKLYVVDDVQEKLSAADNLSDDDRAVAVKVMCLANEAYKAAWEHRGRKLGELLDFQKGICISFYGPLMHLSLIADMHGRALTGQSRAINGC